MVYIAVAASLMTVCSWISLPSVVPITMQMFAIFVTLGILGGKIGSTAVFLYVAIGVLGVPVFSHFKGGLPIIISDVAGGYIVGFLFVALIYWGAEAIFGNKFCVKLCSMLAGLVVCYAVGVLWYVRINLNASVALGFADVMSVCVIPFVLPDIIKLAMALFLTHKLKRHINVSCK